MTQERVHRILRCLNQDIMYKIENTLHIVLQSGSIQSTVSGRVGSGRGRYPTRGRSHDHELELGLESHIFSVGLQTNRATRESRAARGSAR